MCLPNDRKHFNIDVMTCWAIVRVNDAYLYYVIDDNILLLCSSGGRRASRTALTLAF